ncbi:MAG: hypothetical protein EOM23_04915 [Candidatus Moranbacteria bacterium]|nr:hypothetical protein [Candidatus Moranbacteria bacterium]
MSEIKKTTNALQTAQGEISLRGLLAELIKKKGTSIRQVCQATGQGAPNMSRYLAGKTSLYADNVEKAINHLLDKNEPK